MSAAPPNRPAIDRWAAAVKWLIPGMRVKRWAALALAGAALAMLGLGVVSPERPYDALAIPHRVLGWLTRLWHITLEPGPFTHWLGLFLALAGCTLILYAVGRFVQSIVAAVLPPGASGDLVDLVYRNRFLAMGARIVVIGGGTGLSTMLRGLKRYSSNITAIVTVADDGGSSGKLQRQLNILPPGDIRNCLVALADAEATMTDLFQYRFKGSGTGEGLRDHAFGNLFIAALSEISSGDFLQALRHSSKVLNIRGRVLPSTLAHVCLRAEMEDGSVVTGETEIAHSPLKVRRVGLSPADAGALPEAIEAIETADIIVVGPGSVFTSIVPNLLVRGIAEALHRTRARKVFICNVMTQKGETDGFSASDHVKAVEAHLPRPVFDYVLVNTGVPTLELLDKYRQSGSTLVEADVDRVRAQGYRTITGNFVSQTDVVRHNPGPLAEAIVRLLM